MLAAPITVELPVQIVTSEPVVAEGSGFTIITTKFDLLQPVAVMVSVTV